MSTTTLERPVTRPLDRPTPLTESNLDAMLRPVAAAPRSRVRLTRRGRLVVFVISLFLAFIVGMVIAERFLSELRGGAGDTGPEAELWERLRIAAEQAKQSLSEFEESVIKVELPDGEHRTFTLTRADFEAAIAPIVERLLRRAEDGAGPPVLVRAALRVLTNTSGKVPIARLCKDLRVTRQHLAREFSASVGVGPKFAARVMRVAGAARQAMAGSPWSRVAHDSGFADQSHLSREFVALRGHAPTELGVRVAPAGAIAPNAGRS